VLLATLAGTLMLTPVSIAEGVRRRVDLKPRAGERRVEQGRIDDRAERRRNEPGLIGEAAIELGVTVIGTQS